jgi:rubrerythrin
MAEWICGRCGYAGYSRCKPKMCPNCEASGASDKKKEAGKR